MSRRRETDYLQDMLLAGRRIGEYCKGLTYEDFLADHKTQDAVVRNLEIMGEAAKYISETTCAKSPNMQWRNISRMRDRLIHGYFGVNWDIVWSVVSDELATTLPQLELLTGQMPPEENEQETGRHE